MRCHCCWHGMACHARARAASEVAARSYYNSYFDFLTQFWGDLRFWRPSPPSVMSPRAVYERWSTMLQEPTTVGVLVFGMTVGPWVVATASRSSGCAPDTMSRARRGATGLLAFVYMALGAYTLVDPVQVLRADGLDLSTTGAAGLAEVRAFYFGTLWMLGMSIGAYGALATEVEDHRKALKLGAGTMGCFVWARCYAYMADGSPDFLPSQVVWAAEYVALVVLAALLANLQPEDKARQALMRRLLAVVDEQMKKDGAAKLQQRAGGDKKERTAAGVMRSTAISGNNKKKN